MCTSTQCLFNKKFFRILYTCSTMFYCPSSCSFLSLLASFVLLSPSLSPLVPPPSSSFRRESRVLHLRNNTLLAAAWKLSGTETLGDEFTFSQEQGIVQPKSEFPLTVHFRAVKPAVSTTGNKKAFKIEVQYMYR